MTILNQAVAANQVRDGHQGGIDTGSVNPLYIEQYGGEVEHRFLKDSFMRQFFKFKSVRGTDTVTNDRIGSSSLQKVTRGVRPTDAAPSFDNVSVKVDTIVLARTNQFLLDDFLEHIDTRKEVGVEHGKEIGKFFDESFVVQGSASKPTNVVRTAPEGHQGGSIVILNAIGAEADPDELELAIQDLCQNIEEKDLDVEEAVLLMRPAEYYTLLKNDKLIDRDFSTSNGDYAKGMVLMSCGVRIQKTNRFPTQADVGATHFLSNAGNNNAYDVTQADANCRAVLLMPKALLAGETIPLTSKVYYSDIELQWFIDSYLAYGVTPNRSEHAGGIFRFDPDLETPT